jgi:tripartite-type tricarboxylate transporter receptor subunit TctC
MRVLTLFFVAMTFCMSAMAEYPDKPIRIILPYAPGGGADTVGRPLAVALSKVLGVSVYVENKGGASGNIAMQYVANSSPNGYTVVLPLTAQVAVNQSLFKHLPYDPQKDFAPISVIGEAPYFLAVNPSFPAKNLQEFIDVVRKNPGKYSYASTGLGSGLHLSMELLESMAKINMVHVPYTGAGAAYTDVLAGRVQATFAGVGSAKGFLDAGLLRPLAVTTPQRSAALPNVPTMSEAGLPGYESYVWYALLAPKGTPAPVIQKLHDAVVAALKTPEVQKEFAADGIQPIGSTPEQLTSFITSETVKWSALMKRAGVAPE